MKTPPPPPPDLQTFLWPCTSIVPQCLASMHPKPSVKMVQFMASQHHIRHNKFLLEIRIKISDKVSEMLRFIARM